MRLGDAEDLDSTGCKLCVGLVVCLLAAPKGFFPPCRQYRDMGHEANVKSAWSTAGNCDLIMFIVDAYRQVRCTLCKLDQPVWFRPAVLHV